MEEDTITAGCYDATGFPPWGALDRFTVEPPNARWVARGAEHSFGGMEDGDVFNGLDGWTGGDGRGSSEGGILLVEEEILNKFLKVFLLNVYSELPN